MNWEQALSDIESHEFAARLNVVSDMRSFFAAAGKEPAVGAVYTGLRESGELREEVLGRINDLAHLQVDLRYENPKDTPLAILLWLATFTGADYPQTAANVVDRAPQCWYAKKLARALLMPPPVASGSSNDEALRVSEAATADAGIPPRLASGETSGDNAIRATPTVEGVRDRHHPWAMITAGASSG